MRRTASRTRALCAGIAIVFVAALAGCAATSPAASADPDRKAANAQKREALVEMEKQGQRD